MGCRAILALTVASTSVAAPAQAADGLRWQSGIGGGASGLIGDALGEPDDLKATLVFDGKLVGMFSRRFGIHTYSNFTIRDFELIGEAYDWLTSPPLSEHAFLTWPLFFLAPFAGTNLVALTPGATFYAIPGTPALYVEAGLGPGVFIEPRRPDVIFGWTVQSGVGFEMTEGLGVAFRTLWSPPALHQFASSNDRHVLAGALMLQLF